MQDSPRLAAVRAQTAQLLAEADRLGAHGVGLVGSVARGTDHDDSDIDFYVRDFQHPDGPEARLRANELVRLFKAALAPYAVDVRGIPGWLLDPPHQAAMRRDWTDLRDLG